MTDVLRFVNPASNGGNGTTSALTGDDAAYASMTAWDAAEQTNLVTDLTNIHRVKCAGLVDSTRTVVGGWTTDATHRIIIEGDRDQSDGFNGGAAFSTAFYHKVLLGGQSGADQLRISELFVTVDGIQHLNSGSSAAERACMELVVDADGDVIIKNCKFKSDSADNEMYGIWFDDINTICTVEACSFEWTANDDNFGIRIRQVDTVNIHGCTISGADDGINIGSTVVAGDTVVIRNCNIFNSDTTDISDANDGASVTIEFNGSDDDVGTSGIDLSPGVTEADDWAEAFVDFANGNYKLVADGPCIGSGTATDHLSEDQIGVTYGTDDLGCFAFPVSVLQSTMAIGIGLGL